MRSGNLIQLTPDQFTILQPFFQEPAAFNLSLKAVLAGTAPGEAWADDVQQPTLGLVNMHPAGWGDVLSKIWVNDAALQHLRRVLESGERIGAEWLATHWSFASLKGNAAFQAMVAALSS